MNIANNIFDAVAEMAVEQMHQHAIAEKRSQITNMQQRRCGNCDHWMKTSCRPEKEGGQLKSISSLGCSDFEPDWFSMRRTKELQNELATLEAAKAAGGES